MRFIAVRNWSSCFEVFFVQRFSYDYEAELCAVPPSGSQSLLKIAQGSSLVSISLHVYAADAVNLADLDLDLLPDLTQCFV
jgi:hypothetical protein